MRTSIRKILTVVAMTSTFMAGLVATTAPAGAATRDPVILVAGTISPGFAMEPLASRLRSDGYDVTIFELPTLGLQDINVTAKALATFVDQVRASKGVARVDLVGHSQGGLVARDYVKSFGGASKVDSLVTLGAPNQGTAIANLIGFFGNCLGVAACAQMSIGSSFLSSLNAGDDTIGSIRYTTIRTLQDELVRPVDNAKLFDGAINVLIQTKCWARVVGHVGLILDGTVYSAARQALEGNTSISPNCFAV